MQAQITWIDERGNARFRSLSSMSSAPIILYGRRGDPFRLGNNEPIPDIRCIIWYSDPDWHLGYLVKSASILPDIGCIQAECTLATGTHIRCSPFEFLFELVPDHAGMGASPPSAPGSGTAIEPAQLREKIDSLSRQIQDQKNLLQERESRLGELGSVIERLHKTQADLESACKAARDECGRARRDGLMNEGLAFQMHQSLQQVSEMIANAENSSALSREIERELRQIVHRLKQWLSGNR